MRKIIAVMLCVCVLAFAGCSNTEDTTDKDTAAQGAKYLEKEGIAPYDLSEGEEYILNVMNIKKDALLVSYNATENSKMLMVRVYNLNDGQWDETGNLTFVIADDNKHGTISIMEKDNYVLELSTISASAKSEKIDDENEYVQSQKTVINDFQNIELNKEIPVAIYINDSDTAGVPIELSEFSDPSNFEGIDLVRAVTFEFMDETL
ncbi:MAG: hypothetical protein MSA01_03600 [Anaeromassilibacillus sp.]|nr:hypothetical protein [Anaeromassilibacillus sp.]MDY3779659.1 hypothetical protein [Candidatus Limousia pullorum]